MALKPIKGNPGRFLDTDSGRVLNISEYREDDKYDTIVVANTSANGIDDGTQFYFFRDIERKLPIDTNFTQPSRLGAGEKMVVDRIGLSVENSFGNNPVGIEDFIKVVWNAHLRINVNTLLLTEGPAIKYASGYGLSGSISGMAAMVDGVLNIGSPSPAAVSRLLKTQTLTAEHEILGILTYFSRQWVKGYIGNGTYEIPEIDKDGIFIKCWLHGLFKTAVNK